MAEEEKKSTYRGFTKAQEKAHKKYMENFVEINVRMTKEKREVVQCYAANCGRRKQRFIFGVFSSPTAQSVRRRHDHGGTTARSHRPVSGHQTTWCFETGL